jgi:50S ribosomal protein L16 3-hydroxylase
MAGIYLSGARADSGVAREDPMQLAQFDSEAFLRDYWQKKPLLIRNPWKAWSNPLDPDELAGLACEPGVESRLVTQAPNGWNLEHGPLPEDRFGRLQREPWTLLVQAVDHHVPEVAALLEPFRFVPNWRVDDVMVSYAADGGGVGAHFDQYDVFLVQGLGQRRWQIGASCDSATELLPHDDLRLLAHFEPVEEWILGPGDILYVPPRVAHNGVAVGDDCMTYSIGFRAPSRAELLADWSTDRLAELHDDDRYADPGLTPQSNPGEITGEALARLHALAVEALLDREAFARWFGEYTTAPKNPEIDWRPERPIGPEALQQFVRQGVPLTRNPASRFSFVRQAAGSVALFVDGEAIDCGGDSAAFAQALCAHAQLPLDPSVMEDPATRELLLELLNNGSVAFEADH